MNYEESGVSIEEGNKAVDLIKEKVKSTHTPGVLGNIGNFAGFFELPQGYKNPVLVSCTDGVGTKLKLAIDTDILDTVGIDLVAMSVNDLICSGAKPLYFLDYIACHKLNPQEIDQIITGITKACKETDTALIGGEMAEMNDLYKPGDFDLAGFCVGIVEKSKIIDGSKIKANDKIYALPSSGIHSNGYSLVRKVMTNDALKRNNLTKAELLTPTKLYVNETLKLIETHTITGIAHITGGGLEENIERILPKDLSPTINWETITTPEIFNIIQKEGNIATEEMRRVFNMGVGLTLITPDTLQNLTQIGTITQK